MGLECLAWNIPKPSPLFWPGSARSSTPTSLKLPGFLVCLKLPSGVQAGVLLVPSSMSLEEWEIAHPGTLKLEAV